jgi:prepilin-type N-terminal cleavage/methylation domain-containing protein
VKSGAKSGDGLASEPGFTLAEMLIVVTIVLVVGGMSIPSLSRTIDNYRIKGATRELAAAYQDARIRAAQNNTSYEVLVSQPGIRPAQVCIDLNGDGACSTGEPVTAFSTQISLSNAGVPLPLGTQLKFPVADTESALAAGLVWNVRGLPCQRDSATSPCTAKGWVQHLQLQRSTGEILYSAVTVSTTGSVKTWIYIPSGSGNGQWF